ncbi:MAG: hypothetical protein IKY12_06915, partial [Clostridia bacterium]|nr:hypothetical protein [Clostridia bacterium]
SVSYTEALSELLRHFINAEIGSGFEFSDGFSYEGEPILNSEYGGVGAFKGDLDVSLCFKYLTDLLRMQEMLNGYIYTEPYDIEYERNGILSYDRRAKVFPYGEMAYGGDMGVNDLTSPCFVGIYNEPAEEIAAGGTFSADAVALNFSAKTFMDATLNWRFDATDVNGNSISTGLCGSLEISYAPYTAERYPISFKLPNQPCVGTVTIWVEENGEKIAKNFINVIVTGEIAETEYFSKTSVALRDTDCAETVSGTGKTHVEYEIPEDFDLAMLTSMRVLAEVSSYKRSTFNYGVLNDVNSQTVSGGERPSDLTVSVNGIEIDTVYLPDNPRDMRAVLTINDKLNGGSSAGNFGYVVNLRIPEDKMGSVKNAIARDGKITVTYEVKEDAVHQNGLRLYGSNTGRYMLSPTVLLNPMDTAAAGTKNPENYTATATLEVGDTLSVRGGAVTVSLEDGKLIAGDFSYALSAGAHTVSVRVFDTHYQVFADNNPVAVIDFYDDVEYTSLAASATGEGLIVSPETYARLLGDVDGSGNATITDVLVMLRALVNDEDLPYSDTNGDGTLTLADVIHLLRVISA